MEFAEEESQQAPGLVQHEGGTAAAGDVSEESKTIFPFSQE